MATSPIEKQIYPFSTEDAKVIPLDVIRPLNAVKVAFPAAGVASFVIPVGWIVASFYSPTGCFIQFNATVLVNPLANNTAYADTLFVPPNCMVTATVIPGAATIVALVGVADYVVMQQIQKWAGLALNRQLSRI